MNEIQLRQTIVDLVRAELRLDGPLPDGELSEILDSVQRLSLVVALEDHFAICFEADDEEGARTLDDVVRIVQSRLAEASDA